MSALRLNNNSTRIYFKLKFAKRVVYYIGRFLSRYLSRFSFPLNTYIFRLLSDVLSMGGTLADHDELYMSSRQYNYYFKSYDHVYNDFTRYQLIK